MKRTRIRSKNVKTRKNAEMKRGLMTNDEWRKALDDKKANKAAIRFKGKPNIIY